MSPGNSRMTSGVRKRIPHRDKGRARPVVVLVESMVDLRPQPDGLIQLARPRPKGATSLLEHLAVLGHAHDHRPAAVQIDADILMLRARSSFASGHFVRNPECFGSPSEEDFRVLAVAPTPSPQGDAGTRDLHALTDQRDATRSLLHGVSSGADATIWRMREETRPDELLLDRVRAVEKMLVEANKIIVIGDMKWEEVEADLRLLAINHALRRQLEGLDGALLLVKSTLGHLSVSFVRPALEEMIWLKYLSTLSGEKATKLLLVLGTYDALRSLLAQRDHIGDEGMRGLWYKTSFLDAANEKLDSVKLSLKDLAKEFGWSGMLPSAQWIATQADELGKYKYLHAASSPRDTLLGRGSNETRVGRTRRKDGHEQTRV